MVDCGAVTMVDYCVVAGGKVVGQHILDYHGPDVRKPKRKRTRCWVIFKGRELPIVIGLVAMCFGVLAGFWGVMSFFGASDDRDMGSGCIFSVGGILILLAGLWFMTSDGIKPARLIGLVSMVSGISCCFWGNMLANDPSKPPHQSDVRGAFLIGLSTYFLGFLTMVYERFEDI